MKADSHDQPTADQQERSAAQENRAHRRFKKRIDAWLQILFPEETFQPTNRESTIHDISMRGMKLLVSDISEDFFRRLINKKRYARISLIDPETGDKLKISGLIVWYDFHSPEEGDRNGKCMMGVFFDKTGTSNIDEYVAFVERNTVKELLWDDLD